MAGEFQVSGGNAAAQFTLKPDVVSRLEKIGSRLKIVIDDDGHHGKTHSGETQAAKRLSASAGDENVKRQHMGKLQHNKTIV
ncbi:MAG: hypothetical protein ACREQK_17795, partial [Candidatus Binatia bacterium]